MGYIHQEDFRGQIASVVLNGIGDTGDPARNPKMVAWRLPARPDADDVAPVAFAKPDSRDRFGKRSDVLSIH
jgi:hypothetical protein